MLKQIIQNFSIRDTSQLEAVEVRRQFESVYIKIKNYQNFLEIDHKLNFNAIEQTIASTFFLGAYAVRYEFDNIKSIQLFRRGEVDNLQYCELLAISFQNQVEYITDALFVKADIFQLEILVNHVIKSHTQTF